MNTADLSGLIKEMDKLNMAAMINLSGRGFRSSGDHLERCIDNIAEQYPKCFVLFTNIDFGAMDDADWTARTVKQLEMDVKRGAKGLKIYKSLGMFNRDSNGNHIHIDDPRIDPVWAKCGEPGIPILIHAADPNNFGSPSTKPMSDGWN